MYLKSAILVSSDVKSFILEVLNTKIRTKNILNFRYLNTIFLYILFILVLAFEQVFFRVPYLQLSKIKDFSKSYYFFNGHAGHRHSIFQTGTCRVLAHDNLKTCYSEYNNKLSSKGAG